MVNTVHTRVFECPDCGGVAMGYGAMGNTRDFECLNDDCNYETTKRDKQAQYIERDIPDDISYTDVDGPEASYGVPSDVTFDEFMSEHVNEKYQT